MIGAYMERAQRIVDRVMPPLPVAHGFYDPRGFVERSRYNRSRKVLYWRTFARIRAKVEGGQPFLKMPADTYALRGSAMAQVARELESAA